MATWEDGPEYAPLERPSGFDQPPVAHTGLEPPAPTPPPIPPTPGARPRFADPELAVPALADLAPTPPARRDPNQPFAVAASVLTAAPSSWAAGQGHHPPGTAPAMAAAPFLAPPTMTAPVAPSAAGSAAGPLAPQPGPPNPGLPNPGGWARYGPGGGQVVNGGPPGSPGPAHQLLPPTYPGPPAGQPGYPPPGYPSTYPPTAQPGYPAAPPPSPPPAGQQGYPPPTGAPFPGPGTPEWLDPGRYPQPTSPAPEPTAKAVLAAATPGLVVTLVVGGLVWVLAPVTVVLAALLARRMTHGRRASRIAFGAVFALLALVGLVGFVTADGVFSLWWDNIARWACLGSWVLLAATLMAAYHGLRHARPDLPPPGHNRLR